MNMTRTPWIRSAVIAVAAVALALPATVTPVAAQQDSIPSVLYYSVFPVYQAGNFADAIKGFERAGRSAIKGVNGRWIDSICYHTMLGEAYYQMGNNAKSLDHHRLALQQYLQYPNWMVRVDWAPIRPSSQTYVIPWGKPQRVFQVGHYSNRMGVTLGDVQVIPGSNTGFSNLRRVPVDVTEIVRCIGVSIRRYRELSGPNTRHDPLMNSIVTELSRRSVPPNTWAESLIDVLLGLAHRAVGKDGDAQALLKRGLVASGRYDHPLTPLALLELGHIALWEANFTEARDWFLEASYSAYAFELGGPDVVEEAMYYGFIANHLANRKQPFAPLETVATFASKQKLYFLQASAATALAEDMALLGRTSEANAALANAWSALAKREMQNGRMGCRYKYVQAIVAYQSGNISAGDEALAKAIEFQRNGGSVWLFQIALADSLYTSGKLSPRSAEQLFETVLRDPGRGDWLVNPLESLTMQMTPHPLPYEHWFEVCYGRNDIDAALEVADRIRRHRFYSTLGMGGRLIGLRWMMEDPGNLSQEAALARRDILLEYPAYEKLTEQAQQLRAALRATPLVPNQDQEQKTQQEQLAQLGQIGMLQEALLRQIAIRREYAPMIFPVQRSAKDIQKAMPPSQSLLVFYASSRHLYAFLLGHDRAKYATWTISSPALVTKHLKDLLREMGNFDGNRTVPVAEFAKEDWKNTAAKLYDLLIPSKVQLPENMEELVIVPDGALWYVPFEALQFPVKDGRVPLISKARVRYALTASLAVPDDRARKPSGNLAVVLGRMYPSDPDDVAQTEFDALSRVVKGAVALPRTYPAPSAIYGTLFDRLMVWQDFPPDVTGPYGWSPALDSGRGATLDDWLALPWGAPDEVILPTFHTPAENALKSGGNGQEIFLAAFGLMATGTRTILISRWRTGGQTSYDLVREFVSELPKTTAAAAWQRAVFLTMDADVRLDREPRLSATTRDTIPKGEHPFFWAGYVLIDTGTLPQKEELPAAIE